jgi:exportin-T
MFDNTITVIEHFARDPSDINTARIAFNVLSKMIATWGGPDIQPLSFATSTSAPEPPPNSPVADLRPSPTIPGFDVFAVTRFSPLSWAIPASAGFKTADAGGRMLVCEIAAMQQEILKKNGRMYVESLRGELAAMGAGAGDVQVYVAKLSGDKKGFQEFLVGFLGRGG